MKHPIDEKLCWLGFRPLTPAELAAGALATNPKERRLVRVDAASLSTAVVLRVDDVADVDCFRKHLEVDAWGYDLNICRQAHAIDRVDELYFVEIAESHLAIGLLPEMTFEPHGGLLVGTDRACSIPVLGPDFAGEIFPGLGWVLAPGATSEFGPSEQLRGFYSTVVPPGAASGPSSRAYRFIHAGYPVRTIVRRRIVAMIDPTNAADDIRAIVDQAVVATYGET